MATKQEILDIIVEQLGVSPEEVTMEKGFIEDLNADSLDLTELVMTLEERYSIEIPQEDAEKMRTVADLVNYVLDLTGAGNKLEDDSQKTVAAAATDKIEHQG